MNYAWPMRLIALNFLHNLISSISHSSACCLPFSLLSQTAAALPYFHFCICSFELQHFLSSSITLTTPSFFSSLFILCVSLTPTALFQQPFSLGNRHHLSLSVILSLCLFKLPLTKLHYLIILSHVSLTFLFSSSFIPTVTNTTGALLTVCVCECLFVCVSFHLSVLLFCPASP